MKNFKITKTWTFNGLLVVGSIFVQVANAQPTPPPAPYLDCAEEPQGAATDTVQSSRDAEGFYSLFDGTTATGWWEDCGTAHGGPAKWKVVPELKAIFSTQDGSRGGLLMTKKKFLNYELIWDYWPDFKNDGGIFNRSPGDGSCFQTVLDYIDGASLGGTWGERNFGHRDFRPFSFSGSEDNITIPGNNEGEPSNWTIITQKLMAAGQKFDCPATGCTQADWRRLWDQNNWNELRLKFYGGTQADNRVRMKFWFRKVGATDWVPVSADTTLMQVIPEGYIGLQVHSGGRFSGANGTWYRNIRWTPLDAKGNRLYTTSTLGLDGKAKTDIQVGSNSLSGFLNLDHEIILSDAKGQVIQSIKGKAGNFQYSFVPRAYGWISMKIKTSKGTEYRSFVRDIN